MSYRWKVSAAGSVVREPQAASSSKMLSQVDTRERSLGASVVFDVPDPCVEGQVLCHLLVGVEVDGVEPGALRLGFGELEEGSPKPCPKWLGWTATLSTRNPSSVTVRTMTPTMAPWRSATVT